MDENTAEGEDPDQDIIQLLNAKKKNREILSITSAAVDAVSSRRHTQTKKTFVGHGSNNLYQETKENNNSISESFTSTRDVSFNGRHRVRVSSRLLREIKSPLDRSNSGNEKSSSETGTHSSSTLFTSQSSSNGSSIQATGPVPTVIKYSPVPARQMKTADVTGHHDTNHKRSTPVVVKYTQGHLAHTVDSVLTENRNATNYKASTTTSHQGPNEVQLQKGLKNKTELSSKTECSSEVNSSKSDGLVASSGKKAKKLLDSSQKSASAHQDCLTREDKEIRKTGLCQGALSNNLLHVADSAKGQVKAVSFSLSEREKATREMLSKRHESKAAIRRVVQPKIVESKTVKENYAEPEGKPSVKPNDDTTKNAGVAVSLGSAAVFQHSSDYENRMNNLMSTLGAIETKCQETRVWQEKQQEELEKSLKERDERRLQNLEDIQKQLLECQLKNTITAPPMTASPHPTTEGLSNTQVKFTKEDQHAGQHPELLQLAARNTSSGLVQGAPAGNPQYSPAAEHKSMPSFKTSVYSKPRDVKVQSGLKRKFVRNTRTQTSPQYSSSVSSSEMTSPLMTPLPRKRLPVPTPRDSKTDRELGRKHVHFDTPDVRNAEKFVKRRVGQHAIEAISDRATTGGHSQTRYFNTSHDSERQTLLTGKRSEDSDYIVNDIGKLRQELKDALQETERTKLSLKNLHDNIHSQISDEDILAPPDHTQPYPLDAYLRATRDIPEEPETRNVEEDLHIESGEKCNPQGHYADALCILRDVQRRKETLESNLMSLTRQHEEQHLYRLVDDLSNEGTTSETLRIRKEVAKKIEEIETVVQCELQDEEREKLALKKEILVENPKVVKSGTRSSHGVPLSTERRAKIRNTTGKENLPRAKPAPKPKQTTKPVAKQPPVKRPLEDASYVSRVYGRQDHVPRRTTVKPSHLHYQSPVAPTKPTTTVRDKAKHQQRWNDSVSSVSDEDRHLPPQSASHKQPRYYFQASMDTSQAVIKSHFKNIQAPLPGQLMSMAIPLGKPKTDPSLRLPVSIDEEPFHSNFQTVSSSVKQPNVAVITIRDEEWLEDDDQPIKNKKRTRAKQRVALERQVLPNVDIDTSSPSEVSDSPVAKVIGPQILPCPEPLPRPGASEYEEFKDYEGVRNLEEMEEGKDDEESVHDGESIISLHGTNKARQSSYQGPAFPPQNIPPDLSDRDGFERALIDERTASETLENKAMEWIEQELLARVVSEMAPPRPDPTATLNRTQSSSSFTDTDDTNEPDLLATIGLRGIQLFVDAGIPVDNDLVRNLITEVLKEKVTSMIGYPKPQEELSPQEMPVEDHAEDESLQEESTRIETPVRTPSAASLPASEARSHIFTPDESKSLDSSSSLLLSDDMTKNVTVVARGHAERDVNQEDDGIEEGHLDDSVDGSPVATPVVTPSSSPRQSIVQLHTPEVSDQDLPGSEKTGVETPEITVSIRDRTPVDSLQEEELKEQTLIEDTDEEEDKKTGVEIPIIKFELKPEPSDIQVTNSPSSITTTTYSTHSTMGTVATEDEISEGEQLQPFVHIGQYSEGEFAAPSAHVPDNMATMQEIPDDVFDSFNTNKRPDVFKQAVSGFLRLDDQLDETSEVTEDSTSSEAQQRGASETLLSQGLLEDDVSRSEGEVAVNRDVVAALLAKIRRQPLNRKRGSVGEHGIIRASPSVGELVEGGDLASVVRGLHPASQGDLSPGEVSRQNPNLNQQSSEQSIDRPQGSSVFDSDENNNESERSSSLNDVRNQSWSTKDMVTPQKTTTSVNRPSSIKYHEATNSKAFPPIVMVTETRQSTPTGFFLGQRNEDTNRDQDNVTMETLSDIESSPGNGHVMSQATRIQLTLPSLEPNGSVSEGPLVPDSDETIGDTSSMSGGELP